MLASLVAWTAPACAQDAPGPLDEARAAQLRGERARAAELFEAADRASPSPDAIRGAIGGHRAAGQLARAATLSARALERHPDDAQTRALAEEVLAEARGQLGVANVACDPACALALDGHAVWHDPVTAMHVFVEPGEHRVTAGWPGSPEASRELTIEIGAVTEVSLAPAAPELEPEPSLAPEPASSPDAPRRGGIGPAAFGVGAAITAFGAGLAIWSGIETLAARDVYVESPTRAGYENGVTLEWRTNGLWIGTAAVGVASVIVAFFTDWGTGALIALAPLPGGAYATLGGTLGQSEW